MQPEARPDAQVVLDGLKDFQLATVDHVFRRLYTDPDSSPRFLVADEVGLGKTLIARGVVAKAVEHLWDKVERIDVLYICSNLDIARQNVDRLKLPGREDIPLASRLTLLPALLPDLKSRRLNLISFTPATSLDPRSSMGTGEERALVYLLLERAGWIKRRIPALNLLQGGIVRRDTFEGHVDWMRDERTIDASLAEAFAKALSVHDQATGPEEHLRDRFEDLCDRFARARKWIPDQDRWDRAELIAELRALLATTCATALEPDLIILDEFQRFRSLLQEGDDQVARLARDLFTWQCDKTDARARVLLLSATPYKPFTNADDGGEDHYRDFIATLRFLFDDDSATNEVEKALFAYKQELITAGAGDADRLAAHRKHLERLLMKVMSRTERLGAGTDRNGMLRTIHDAVALDSHDVSVFMRLQQIGDELGSHSTLEYWKSAPYVLNFMDGYDLKRKLRADVDAGTLSPAMVELLRPDPASLLPWNRIERFGELPAPNAKMASLFDATVDAEAWRLLWVPPSLPYYEMTGAYGDARLRNFTKRLVFSAWHLVPRAVSLMLSYEAERRMTRAFDHQARNSQKARDARGGLLAFTRTEGRLTGMPVLGLLYPSVALARACDPLRLAAQLQADGQKATLASLKSISRTRVRELLEVLPQDLTSRPGMDGQIDPSRYPFTWHGDEPSSRTPDWCLHLAHKGEFRSLRDLTAAELIRRGCTRDHLECLIALSMRSTDRSAEELVDHATRAVTELQAAEQDDGTTADIEDEAWYWAAPILLDLALEPETTYAWWNQSGLEAVWRGVDTSDAESGSRWAEHVDRARRLLGGEVELGRMPSDLDAVLALIGIAGPGVCALRALERAVQLNIDDPGDLRNSASHVAWALRSLFNLPEVTALVREGHADRRYWELVLRHGAAGCLQAVLDEYAHVLVEALGVASSSLAEAADKISEEMSSALSLRTASLRVDDIRAKGSQVSIEPRQMRTRFAAPFSDGRVADDGSSLRPAQVRRSFNSPFWPFVLVSTSVGQEGLDFHQYCHAVVHWNLPSNPVDLEQREGRVHRYKSHAVRRNLAERLGSEVLATPGQFEDPWRTMFRLGAERRETGMTDLVPYWLYRGTSKIERHLPNLPFSREIGRFDELQRALAVYRMAFGQSRQDDLVSFLLQTHTQEQIDQLLKVAQLNLSPG